MNGSPGGVHIELLADRPDLIPVIGELRWHEWGENADWGEDTPWGEDPERIQLGWWVDITARESGRDELPVTFVAVDARGAAAGAVGLGRFDPDERRHRSPWILGMIVRPDLRGHGIGRMLLDRLCGWAEEHGFTRLWVATGDPAVAFYQSCGWALAETFARPAETVHLLTTNAGPAA